MRVPFTAKRIECFTCPTSKSQAFLWDASVPGLALRVTENGARAYVVQGRLAGRTVRLTIGDPRVWQIPEAQAEARRFLMMLDQGRDPRAEKAAAIAEHAAKKAQEKRDREQSQITGLNAWAPYLEAKKSGWRARTYMDHVRHSKAGGQPRERSKVKTTIPGVLYPILSLPLASIDNAQATAWAKREATTRPTITSYGVRMLKAFLRWCAKQEDYKHLAHPNACEGLRTSTNARKRVLDLAMLEPWFTEVQKEPPVVGAYLQCVLLTGARREEMMNLQWPDIDFRFRALHLADKVEDDGRRIPLTPYVAHLLANLPRRHPKWVFSSLSSANGRLQEVTLNHARVIREAGLAHLTLHDLRRSYITLGEGAEPPAGVLMQLTGHKPSGVHERNYKHRSLDMLRPYAERIEKYLLQEAGIQFTPVAPGLRAVA